MRSFPFITVTAVALLAAVDTRADTYPRQSAVDIVHYMFRLSLDDPGY